MLTLVAEKIPRRDDSEVTPSNDDPSENYRVASLKRGVGKSGSGLLKCFTAKSRAPLFEPLYNDSFLFSTRRLGTENRY